MRSDEGYYGHPSSLGEMMRAFRHVKPDAHSVNGAIRHQCHKNAYNATGTDTEHHSQIKQDAGVVRVHADIARPYSFVL